jgi:hypothetical protein
MKKRTILTCLAVLALASTSHAQFTFKTAEGKTLSNKNAPDVLTVDRFTKDAYYFVWEKDHVRIYSGKVNDQGRIECLYEHWLYYENFKSENATYKELDGFSYYYVFFQGKSQIPKYTYFENLTTGEMVSVLQIKFPDKKTTDAFITKLIDKKLEMSLDLDYTPPAKLVIEGKYQFPPEKEEAPKPAPKRVSEDFYVTLVNDSKAEIHVLYQEKPDSNSVRSIIISPGSYKMEKVIAGSQIFWRNPKRLALMIKRSMEDTRVILAK